MKRNRKEKKIRGRIAAALIPAVLMLAAAEASVPLLESEAFAAEKQKTIYIESAEDFEKLAENCVLDTWSQGKKVVLKADISLEEVNSPVIPTFGGTFDGGGHTISGVKITGSLSPSGLFGTVQVSGIIKNLNVSGTVAPSGDGSNAGGIAGENYGKITGCTFTGNVSGGSSTGGIAGVNALSGRISGCSSSGAVIGRKMTGGIAGCNLGTVSESRNNAYVNTDGTDPSINPEDIDLDFSLDLKSQPSIETEVTTMDTGGIAGYSSGILESCTNAAPVGYPHTGYNVGGIAGRNCGYIRACENEADISGRKDVGGIVGQMEPYIAQNISESTLSRLEDQLEQLDTLLNRALNDGNAGVGNVTSRLNRIADYMDSAAGAASDIRTNGNVTTQAESSGSAGGKGNASSGSSVTIGQGQGKAEGEARLAAGGNASVSTQITMTTSLGGLSSAICGMSGQMRLLNDEIAGMSGVLTSDLKAIQKQINAISDTVMELFQGGGEGDVLIDSSDTNISDATLGKAYRCTNSGSVSGDVNTGGIAGAMSMEASMDPEDDASSNLSSDQRKTLEVKAIIQKCVNTGKITVRHNYAGGICGRMDLGLITRSEGYGRVISEHGDYVGGIAGVTASTVRRSFAKCFLSGGEKVGGIVGSGVEKEISGSSSTVKECCSMVSIEACREFAGAVSGADAGIFKDNYFVSDTLAGINGRSYTGKAEPVTYKKLLKMADEISLPEAFRQFTLTFEADGEAVKTISFEYGDSFDETAYPEIPEKEGYYGSWEKARLEDLHFDTVVRAVYTPYVSALTNSETRADGRPIFFIEGLFDEGEEASITAIANTPEEFDDLADGWQDLLKKSLSGSTVNRQIVEQWRIAIPDDGTGVHTVRYLPPDGETENLDIYVRDGDGWKKTETETIGSYLSFPMDGQVAEIAVISTARAGWIRLLVLGLLIAVVVLELLLIRRKMKKNRKQKEAEPAADPVPEAVTSGRRSHSRKKRKSLPAYILIALLILAAAGGAAAGLLLPKMLDGAAAFELLEECAEKEDLAMKLTVDADLGNRSCDFTADISRTSMDGRRVTAISQDGRTLYYSGDCLFLENGNAYQISGAFPDYSELLTHVAELYRNVDIGEKDGIYTITASGSGAKNHLQLLLPAAADEVSDTETLEVKLITEEEEVTEIRFSGNGTLAGKTGGETGTVFRISAVLDLQPENQNAAEIPQDVKEAIAGGGSDAVQVLSEDILRMTDAWRELESRNPLGARISLEADCGPVALDESLNLYRWNDSWKEIFSIQKNGYAVYFTDTAICGKDGKAVLKEEAPVTETAELLDLVCQICLNASMECSESGENYIYTISLDEEGMENVAHAVAPETEKLDLLFDSGSLQAVICGEQLQSVKITCGGKVQVANSEKKILLETGMEFAQETPDAEIPEAVRTALEK